MAIGQFVILCVAGAVLSEARQMTMDSDDTTIVGLFVDGQPVSGLTSPGVSNITIPDYEVPIAVQVTGKGARFRAFSNAENASFGTDSSWNCTSVAPVGNDWTTRFFDIDSSWKPAVTTPASGLDKPGLAPVKNAFWVSTGAGKSAKGTIYCRGVAYSTIPGPATGPAFLVPACVDIGSAISVAVLKNQLFVSCFNDSAKYRVNKVRVFDTRNNYSFVRDILVDNPVTSMAACESSGYLYLYVVGNSDVTRLDSNDTQISWKTSGAGLHYGLFDTIRVDSECNVIVAPPTSNVVQVFDKDGNAVLSLTLQGHLVATAIMVPGGILVGDHRPIVGSTSVIGLFNIADGSQILPSTGKTLNGVNSIVVDGDSVLIAPILGGVVLFDLQSLVYQRDLLNSSNILQNIWLDAKRRVLYGARSKLSPYVLAVPLNF